MGPRTAICYKHRSPPTQEITMSRWIVPLVAAFVTAGLPGATLADGQGKSKDHGKADSPQGQVVSECNHRANDKNLKGQERKDFVEWCESRGAHHKYDDKRYDGEKTCYQKANNKGLTGEKRANFLEKCFGGGDGDDYYGGKVPVKKKD
jgi:hypothetical protein